MGIPATAIRGVTIGAGVVAIFTGAAIATVEWNAWFSGPAGSAGVKIQNNDPNNRIAQTQQWKDLYGLVVEDQGNIKAAVQQPNLGYSLADLQAQCRRDVRNYNDLGTGLTSNQWRPTDLPEQIDPAQYCNVS